MKYVNLKKTIETFGQEKIQEFKQTMQAEGSLHLYNSLNQDIKDNVDDLILTVFGNKAIYYFSEGRRPGKFPPLAEIKSWAKLHDLDPFRDKKGRFITFDARAFLIGRKIAQKGTQEKAVHFIAKIWKLDDEDKNKFMAAYRKDIEVELQTIADKFNQ